MGSEEGGRADQASFVAARRSLKRKGRDKVPIKSREWIVEKKERAKRQGMKLVVKQVCIIIVISFCNFLIAL